jgi:hypothetical protein
MVNFTCLIQVILFESCPKRKHGKHKLFANNLYRIDILFSDFSHYCEVACCEKLKEAIEGRRLRKVLKTGTLSESYATV